MIFLPADAALAERCMDLIESTALREGADVLCWREVPCHGEHLGELARNAQPRIRQVFLCRGSIPTDAFERKLYVIRRCVEKEAAGWDLPGADQFYVVSLSSRTITYKGMLTGTQLTMFYPDLSHTSFTSAYVLVHQRYSTNTFPTWSLAQPFRMLAHNGEINTLRGNLNHMRAREADLASELFGDDIEKLKPILVEGGSDSAIVDNMLELLVAGGRSLPHAALMMVPEAWGAKFHMSDDKRAFYEYHAAIMEPWDGPAALVFTDGRYIGAILDRNGLRPARYTVTNDGYIVVASETGVLELPAERIARRGRLQPGKMLLVDLEQHRIVPDNEIKAKLSRQRGYRRWVNDNRIELRGLMGPSQLPGRGPGRRPAPPARLRLQPRGAEDGHRAHGGPRPGGHRLHGQRRGAGRPERPAAAPVRLLQAALRAGHQPAHRPAARAARHVPDELRRPGAQPAGRDAGARAAPEAAAPRADARGHGAPAQRPAPGRQDGRHRHPLRRRRRRRGAEGGARARLRPGRAGHRRRRHGPGPDRP